MSFWLYLILCISMFVAYINGEASILEALYVVIVIGLGIIANELISIKNELEYRSEKK